jgi:glutathione S-transferase
MKLYIHPASPNSRKPRAVARHLGLDLEEVTLDVRSGAQRQPDYLALNPNGKVPLLVDGDRCVWESAAICLDLARRDPDAGLVPDAVELVRWVAWNHAHLSPPLGTLVFQALFAGEARDPAAVEAATESARQVLAILDGELARRGSWLAGDQLSIADFILGASFTYATPAGLPVDGFDRVAAWLDRLGELEAWRETAPPSR